MTIFHDGKKNKKDYINPRDLVGCLVKPRYSPNNSVYLGLVTGVESRNISHNPEIYREYCRVYWMHKDLHNNTLLELQEAIDLEVLSNTEIVDEL